MLQVKLGVPRTSDLLVRRSNVLEALNESTEVPLTLVTAPAGYGKTTTVAQWANTTDSPVAWISLGPEDNNPSRFLTYLVAAVASADSVDASWILEESATHTDLQETIDLIVGAMSSATRQFHIVLDDFHSLSNVQIHQSMSSLVGLLPPQAHIIIVSRETPPLPLTRLRLEGRLLEIGIDNLSFSTEESLAFRSAAGLDDINDEQWLAVTTSSEGWVAGLQLARLSLTGHDATSVKRLLDGSGRRLQDIDEYLIEEVIDALPDDLRYFVLRSSLLPFLTPELCDHVLDSNRSALLLRDLRKRRLFVVSIGPDRRWLRFHHLFASALQELLAAEVGRADIDAIHAKAAEWFEEQGQTEQAIRHAIACKHWESAARLVRQVCEPLAIADRTLSMRHWLDMLPREVVLADPDLKYLLMWSMAILADSSTEAMDMALDGIDASEPAYEALAFSARMQTNYALGDVDGVLSCSSAALARIPEDMVIARINAMVYRASALYMGGDFGAATTEFDALRKLVETQPELWLRNRGEVRVADALSLRGQLDDAEILLRQLEANMHQSPFPADTQVGWLLASIHLERNNLDLAEKAIASAYENATITGSNDWLVPVHIVRAMIDWALGNLDAAHAGAERARQEARAMGNPNFVQRAEALQAMMWIARGQHILAERWLASANVKLTWAREFNQPYPALAVIRLLTARGRIDQAQMQLDDLIAATCARHRTAELVRLHAMKAGLLSRRDEDDLAAAELAIAIELGAQGGFVRAFTDEGMAIAKLFNHPDIREHNHRNYARMVRQSFDTIAVSTSQIRSGPVESLSLRELEVLRLVSEGESNRSISQELYISEPTVKKHISNILGKLEVLNRTQAVSVARDMGLLA